MLTSLLTLPTQICTLLCREASPHQLLPLEVNTLLVSGSADTDVPSAMVAAFYGTAASAAPSNGVSVQLLELDNCDHYQVVHSLHLSSTVTISLIFIANVLFYYVMMYCTACHMPLYSLTDSSSDRWWTRDTPNGMKFGLKFSSI